MVDLDKHDDIFLKGIPLLRTSFEVEIAMGFADIVLHQVYENINDHPLETIFKLPYSDSFALNKITVDFVFFDGAPNKSL
jgi:hypothetical protein